MNALKRLLQSHLRYLGAVGLALAIVGCNEPTTQRSSGSNVSSPPTASAGPTATAEPSSAAKPNAALTASANDQPQKSMNKQEESTSMPQPAQANDHSTLAGDGKK
jgi:hypothetical protein